MSSMKEVHVLASGMKAVFTWFKADTLQKCRECCGGQGFSSDNRIGIMKTDSDVEQTYEGDNGALMLRHCLCLEPLSSPLTAPCLVDCLSGSDSVDLLEGFV